MIAGRRRGGKRSAGGGDGVGPLFGGLRGAGSGGAGGLEHGGPAGGVAADFVEEAAGGG